MTARRRKATRRAAPKQRSKRRSAARQVWWRDGVVYQIYPRSFMDSNGDGVGDLEGIRQRLDHLSWLGVDAIWISPCFPSPMADFGYDVSDYCDIDPRFGTLADFDRLLADAHERGLRILLDLVPNHSSSEHAWFRESRASRTGAKRDWYVWRDPKADGSPPNNWVGVFGGPAWTLDAATGQYYLHSFLPEQPDLNWRSPALVRAMHEVVRFWFARGGPSASTWSSASPRIRGCATTRSSTRRRGTAASDISTTRTTPTCTACCAACASSRTAIRSEPTSARCI
jgi:hypothetical protein